MLKYSDQLYQCINCLCHISSLCLCRRCVLRHPWSSMDGPSLSPSDSGLPWEPVCPWRAPVPWCPGSRGPSWRPQLVLHLREEPGEERAGGPSADVRGELSVRDAPDPEGRSPVVSSGRCALQALGRVQALARPRHATHTHSPIMQCANSMPQQQKKKFLISGAMSF